MLPWVFVALGALAWWLAIRVALARPFWLRLWLSLLIPVWSLIPVPVENHPDDYAPAMFAAFYELFIAPGGNPGVAIAALVVGTLVLTLAVVGVHFVRRALTRRME